MIQAYRRSRLYGLGMLNRALHPISSYPMRVSISLGGDRRRRRLPLYVIRRYCVNRLGTWNVTGINGIAKR